jgi:transcriptional regulator with XRE-family HTH domain
MKASVLLVYARRHAGLSQRELAERTGVAQPTIARIERGHTSPRFDTMARLLEACEFQLTLSPGKRAEIHRSSIREMLRLRPTERLILAAEEARNLDLLLSPRE